MPRSLVQGLLYVYRVWTDAGANLAPCASIQEAFFFFAGREVVVA